MMLEEIKYSAEEGAPWECLQLTAGEVEVLLAQLTYTPLQYKKIILPRRLSFLPSIPFEAFIIRNRRWDCIHGWAKTVEEKPTNAPLLLQTVTEAYQTNLEHKDALIKKLETQVFLLREGLQFITDDKGEDETYTHDGLVDLAQTYLAEFEKS